MVGIDLDKVKYEKVIKIEECREIRLFSYVILFSIYFRDVNSIGDI